MFNDVAIDSFLEWHAMVSIENCDRDDERYFLWITKNNECEYDHGAEWYRNNNNNNNNK